MSGNTPPWPSLYNPGLEILHIDHRNATQAGGAYLYHAKGASSILTFVHHWLTMIQIYFGLRCFGRSSFTLPYSLFAGPMRFGTLTFRPLHALTPTLATPPEMHRTHSPR